MRRAESEVKLGISLLLALAIAVPSVMLPSVVFGEGAPAETAVENESATGDGQDAENEDPKECEPAFASDGDSLDMDNLPDRAMGDGLAASNAGNGASTLADNRQMFTDMGNGVFTSSAGWSVSGVKGFGIDVSVWQGDIDWAKVKASGVDYVIIRCGYGSDTSKYDDENFEQNVRGCISNGIPFGVYIYSYATSSYWAQNEAQHALRVIREAGLSPSDLAYPVYYDIEDPSQNGLSNATLVDIANTFCRTIESSGYRAGVYASLNWWNDKLNSSSLNQWSKWIAQWNTSCTYESQYDLWQCASDGLVQGISGNVDVNFDFSGIAIVDKAPEGSVTMYRLYNPNSGEHFYTASRAERASLMVAGWNSEGVGWYAPGESSIPVYRLYNPVAGDHHYTMSSYERDSLVRSGWRYERIGWYSDASEGVLMYRLYNPNAKTGAHHYTASSAERNSLVSSGWLYEGTAWYVCS